MVRVIVILTTTFLLSSCYVGYNPVGNTQGNIFKIKNDTWGVGDLTLKIREFYDNKEITYNLGKLGYTDTKEFQARAFAWYEIIFIAPKYQWGREKYRLECIIELETHPEEDIVEISSCPDVTDTYWWDWIRLS